MAFEVLPIEPPIVEAKATKPFSPASFMKFRVSFETMVLRYSAYTSVTSKSSVMREESGGANFIT
ncbi:MAG: hypothetical protein BWY64_03377 [bacterium ADurb.Bin363]|nr:MAG: hypothetical protein BWY64_03377 [bacterium ADurb.Bin363]